MSDADLVGRLRHAHEHSQQRINGSDIFKAAADRIEALAGLLDDMEHLKNTYRDDCHLAEARAESADDGRDCWRKMLQAAQGGDDAGQ